MTPGHFNFVCPQGATFNKTLTWRIDEVTVDLAGYTARMQVRENYKSPAAKLDLTTENGGIVLGAEGLITLEIDAATTAALKARDYVYDLELVTNDTVYRLLEGKFTVTPEVTR